MVFDPGGDVLYQAVKPSSRLTELIELKRPAGLLTSTERKAYRLISAWMGGGYLLFSQVHLLQIFSFNARKLDRMLVGRGMRRAAVEARKKQVTKDWIDGALGKKSVDFLVCDVMNTKPVLAIEIDGTSHEDENQISLDAIKDIIFASAGVSLLRLSNDSVINCASAVNSVQEFSKVVESGLRAWSSRVAELEAASRKPFRAPGGVTNFE